MKTLAAIPCHNEGLAIGSVVLKARKYVDQVLVVDDGSTDDTVEVAEAASAVVVSHEKNTGYGAAVRSCFDYAKEYGFDVMTILDGDGQHDPSYIPDFIEAMKTGKADIAIGSRFLTKNKTIPKYRIVGMKVLNVFTELHGVKTTDSQSGYRTYSRRAIEEIRIRNPDMGAGSEILTQVRDCNLNVVEIPIDVRYDIAGTSSKNPVSHGFGVLKSVIWLIAEKRPLRYIAVPGFIISLVGVFFGIRLLQVYNQTRFFSPAYAMLVAIFLILGALGLFMGLMLNVISKLRVGERGRG
ncbi:MAG: Undecaprenyl-phosphate 4-deoxy-4-formamido-L-arabinose transferase [Candidatus Argoarchaeum ethanivorans]|uniref:Undecaprenyl-phosphate 4-deoxy-4-formamido-L-arabinose transferase n=1 Tax=Candidatus Argoarchaeum ethanivorans TaxID=2608793 RepID=A0A811T8U8_9EURY|nr:MAG: Undecaprenyl-phosphate 4-deoxy-4-formamido-L-arabinose transferase [Candidatus Argoarchaeum ethanivorans]